jgi:hypothetical protein
MSALTTGCFGSFQLTKNFYGWHDSTIDNKFLKSLLFWFPFSIVYSATAFVDVVVFNLIEFWSGSNPLSMNEGDTETEFKTYAGIDYRIDAIKNQFKVTQLNGDECGKVTFVRFDAETKTWFYETENSSIALMNFDKVGETEYVNVFNAAGEGVRFSMDENYSQAEIAAKFQAAEGYSTVAAK